MSNFIQIEGVKTTSLEKESTGVPGKDKTLFETQHIKIYTIGKHAKLATGHQLPIWVLNDGDSRQLIRLLATNCSPARLLPIWVLNDGDSRQLIRLLATNPLCAIGQYQRWQKPPWAQWYWLGLGLIKLLLQHCLSWYGIWVALFVQNTARVGFHNWFSLEWKLSFRVDVASCLC